MVSCSQRATHLPGKRYFPIEDDHLPSTPYVPAVNVAIRTSKGKGRGVFATRRYRAGEVIETAPVLIVPKAQNEALAATFLEHYIFQTDNKKHLVIGLGITSLFNHNEPANAEFFISVESIIVKAKQAISIGAEVTIDYGWGPEEWAKVLGETASGE